MAFHDFKLSLNNDNNFRKDVFVFPRSPARSEELHQV